MSTENTNQKSITENRSLLGFIILGICVLAAGF